MCPTPFIRDPMPTNGNQAGCNRTGRKRHVFGLFSIRFLLLKSWVPKGACGFDPRPRHHFAKKLLYLSGLLYEREAEALRATLEMLH